VFYSVCRTLLAGSQAFKSKVYTEHVKLRVSLPCLGTVDISSDFDFGAGLLIRHKTMDDWGTLETQIQSGRSMGQEVDYYN
jgi:hypothetical protein